MVIHIPVLVDEIIGFIRARRVRRILDPTLGVGSHAVHILEELGEGVDYFGMDRDSEAVEFARRRLAKFPRVRVMQGNFADVARAAREWRLDDVDFIMVDLGLGSHQLAVAERGFSALRDGPLDARFDRSSGRTAADLINHLPSDKLTEIIRKWGEERKASAITREIIRLRPLDRTNQLTDIVRRICRGPHVEKSIARVYQAFRIAVNDELGALERFLPEALRLLHPGGIVGIISYHSLEDRIVKDFYRFYARSCRCPAHQPVCTCSGKPVLRVLTRKPVRPGEAEVGVNPRSRSAKLRCAELIDYGDDL